MNVYTGNFTRNTLPQNHLLGKREGLNTPTFHKQWSTEPKVLDVCTIANVAPGTFSNVPVGKEVRDPGVGNSGLRIPSRTGRSSSPAWSPFGEGGMASLGTKDPEGTTELTSSLTQEQEC